MRCQTLKVIQASFSLAFRRFESSSNQNTMRYVRETLQEHVVALHKMPSQSVDTSKLGAHTMTESRYRAVIPLATDPSIRLQYINYKELVRFGMILEDLDTFAVWLAYRHNQGGTAPMGSPRHHPMIIVTACVDAIKKDHTHEITPASDIFMDGHISWVGRSSLEATICLSQDVHGTQKSFLSAKFVMVSRDPDGQKSVANVPLRATSPNEQQIIDAGEASKKLRKQAEERSLLKTLPTEVERNILHDIFLKTVDHKSYSFRHRVLPPNHVWLKDAKLKNAIICFPIQRNLYNKIFGGYLMRQAYELAWANAAMFARERTKIIAVDDIMFRKSVEIGSLLLLSSQVCYSTERFMEISVNAEVLNVTTGERETTNTFYFTFLAQKDVPIVVPKSYADGMLYIRAKRHFDSATR